MRWYFLGDIHGNRYALDACLRHASALGVSEMICLGDIVGWLPFGNETLAMIRDLEIVSVAGNHDLLVAGVLRDHKEQTDRMQATAYNAGLLSTIPGAVEFLASLPLKLERKDFVVVHHSPFHLPEQGAIPDIGCFDYLHEKALMESLGAWSVYPIRLIFSGHDHVPAVFELKDKTPRSGAPQLVCRRMPTSGDLTIHLDPHSRYWIKAGSVGGPYRDNVPLANTVLYDSDEATVTLCRIPYARIEPAERLEPHFLCKVLPTLQKYLELLKT